MKQVEFKDIIEDGNHDSICHALAVHTGLSKTQIKRAMNAGAVWVGKPVIGDPRYGRGNKNEAGLQLAGVGLKFTCPFGRDLVDIRIDPDKAGL